MTIYEAENFYKLDKREYEVSYNKEFLIWLNEKIDNDYPSFIDLEKIEEMINTIVNWYEFKYPNREFEINNGLSYINYETPKELSKYMDFNQLFFRLSHDARCLIECGYRAGLCGYPYIYIFL